MSVFQDAENIYQSTQGSSQDYFINMINISAIEPRAMQRVLKHPNIPLNRMYIDDVVMFNSVQNMQNKVNPQERQRINRFFTRNDVVQALQKGLSDKLDDKVFQHTSFKTNINYTPQSETYKVSQPQLYQKRLHQGVNLLNNLSSAGKHYFLVNVGAANRDLKKYNHLEYGNTDTLTQSELEERRRLNHINANVHTGMQINHAPALQFEYHIVDNFLKDGVTQEALDNHDLYDNIYQMNKRNRVLAENRANDAKNIDPFGRSNSVQLGNKAQSRVIYDKEHHIGFKVGTLAAITAHHYSHDLLNKARKHALLDDNGATKHINAVFKASLKPHKPNMKRQLHQEGPTL